MEIMITPERYKVMKYVSQQKQAFRLAEMYYLMKRIDSEKWQAGELKIILEWLADMGLIKRKFVKAGRGQSWLYYQSCFDTMFLLERTKNESEIHCIKSISYLCCGVMEKLRYQYACIKEKINRASEHLSNNCPFMIAETDFAIPITPEQKSNIKKKIEQLKR